MISAGTSLLLALLFVLLAGLFFALIYSKYKSWDNFFVFYLFIFIFAMLISLLVRPYTVVIFGVFIAPWFLIGLLFAFLMLKLNSQKYKNEEENEKLHFNDSFASGFALLTWFILYILGVFAISSTMNI